jgi:hypothetical protein
MSRLASAERRSVVLPFPSGASAYEVEDAAPDRPTVPTTDPAASAIAAHLAAIQSSIDALIQTKIKGEPTPEYFRIPPLSSRRVQVRIRKREEGKIRLVLDDDT